MRRVRLTVPIVLLAWSSFVTVGATNAAASQSCVRSNPGVTVDNNWAWSAPGSWGMPGQQLTYAIDVRNYDIGCGSSSFVINVAVASGFAISMPTNTISLKSYSSGYLWAHVTSPSVIADVQGLLVGPGSTDSVLAKPWGRKHAQRQVLHIHRFIERRPRGQEDRPLHRQCLRLDDRVR